MGYRLRLSDLALGDLGAIVAASPGVAGQWLDGLERAVALLAEGPEAHPLAPEDADTGFRTRQMVYRAHRVLYVVEEGAVWVLRVYRGARQRLTLNLLQGAPGPPAGSRGDSRGRRLLEGGAT